MTIECDIAVVGSGFGGSLMAMIARRLGRSVVLLERGRHPRFAIGESSTPLANLLIEELSRRYDLPGVASFSKWGTWQRDHPDVACGLKRGFSFYHHRWHEWWTSRPDRGNELLVAASPSDEIADTHWFRQDFDRVLVDEAQRNGVRYLDEVGLQSVFEEEAGVLIDGTRHGEPLRIKARLVIDATGPRGFLHRALSLGHSSLPFMPGTEALYSHFAGVERWDALMAGGEVPPYPADDAALHHVFDGGWIWVLRFNNGITSAGVAATREVAERFRFSDGAEAWERLLAALPSVARQFGSARPVMPFVHAPALSFRSDSVAGRRWVMLPSAAGFVDPLLSNGFPLTLLGIERLGGIIETDWGTDRLPTSIANYAQVTLRELDVTAELTAGLYANMGDFEMFRAMTLLYFAAAMTAETRRRLGRGHSASSFLLENDAVFGRVLRDCLRLVREQRSADSRGECVRAIEGAIDPINLAHLGDVARRNWYPCLTEDLLEAAPKLGVEQGAIEELLSRCGFARNLAGHE